MTTLVAAAFLFPGAVVAQEGSRPVAMSVPVTVLPLQNARPVASGAWPGGASSLQDLVEDFDAEVDFALSERRATAQWTGPGEVVKQVGRNPLIRVDPERLAYEGLDSNDDHALKGMLYEPLQSQLRALSALEGTRVVALPLRLIYVPADSAGPSGRSGAADSSAGSAAGPKAPAIGHAAVRVALIDTRAAQVLWRGWIPGPPTSADAPGLLAELAARLVGSLSP